MAAQVTVSAQVPEDLRDAAATYLAKEGKTIERAFRDFLEETVLMHSAPPGTECTPEEHDAWFRAEVQKALDDPGPYLSHEEAQREMDEFIREIKAQRAEKAS